MNSWWVFASRQGKNTFIHPKEKTVAMRRAVGQEGGRMHHRCLLFRSTPGLWSALTETPPAMLILKTAKFYSHFTMKTTWENTDRWSTFFGPVWCNLWLLVDFCFLWSNVWILFIAIKQLLHKLFFLDHKENIGESQYYPAPLDSVLWFLNFPLPSAKRWLMFLPT